MMIRAWLALLLTATSAHALPQAALYTDSTFFAGFGVSR